MTTTTDLVSHADAIEQMTVAANGYVECLCCSRDANCKDEDWDYEEAWTRVEHQQFCVVRLNADLQFQHDKYKAEAHLLTKERDELQAKVERLEARLARGEAWCNTHDFGRDHPQVLELRKALGDDGGG